MALCLRVESELLLVPQIATDNAENVLCSAPSVPARRVAGDAHEDYHDGTTQGKEERMGTLAVSTLCASVPCPRSTIKLLDKSVLASSHSQGWWAQLQLPFRLGK